jgi:diguanylate cyclase (GGDEF)-like protein
MERSMPKEALFAAQLELLMRNLYSGTVFAHGAGVVVAIMLLSAMVRPELLYSWVAFMLAVLAMRSWHMHVCLRDGSHRRHPRKICLQLIAGLGLTGLAWTTAYFYVASIAPLNIQYIFLLIVVLIASLALGASVVVREYYISYILCTLFPIGWWNLLRYWDDPYNVVVGVILLLSSSVLMFTCNRIYGFYSNMLVLNWEKDARAVESSALAQNLSERNAELDEVRKRLTEQARVDELTGLYNRRALNERLASELKRSARFISPLSVIMIDVDYFKNYNDNYGHPAGDLVLQRLASVLKATANRAGDVVARYGGEEFMLVLPATDALAAHAVAARIQQALIEQAIEHANSSVSQFLTVSQGLATADPVERLTSHELVARVDEALYAAKDSGRDAIRAG